MEKKNVPRLRDFLANLSEPMPVGRKIALLIRNNAIKVYKRQSCCGHIGEPGC